MFAMKLKEVMVKELNYKLNMKFVLGMRVLSTKLSNVS